MVVNLHDAKVIGLDGSLQGNGSFTHGFVSGYFDQHGFLFMLNSSLHKRIRPTMLSDRRVAFVAVYPHAALHGVREGKTRCSTPSLDGDGALLALPLHEPKCERFSLALLPAMNRLPQESR